MASCHATDVYLRNNARMIGLSHTTAVVKGHLTVLSHSTVFAFYYYLTSLVTIGASFLGTWVPEHSQNSPQILAPGPCTFHSTHGSRHPCSKGKAGTPASHHGFPYLHEHAYILPS